MNDPRLRQLLEHPPRDSERAPDPAFTAAVMALVPASMSPIPASVSWWLAAGVAAVASLLVPIDPLSAIGWSRLVDAGTAVDLLVEMCGAAAVLAVVLLTINDHRRINP